jgi:hypothetical protein
VSFAEILPMAFVMIAGPQLVSAVFFATSERWGRNSLAFIGGGAIAVTSVVTIAYLVSKGVKSGASSSHKGSVADILDSIVLALLLVLAVLVFRRRHQTEPPKWMGKFQTAGPKFAFILGLALLSVFPTDIITSITCGLHVARHDDPWWQVLPFVGLTVLLLAAPAIAVVLLGEKAKVLLPKARHWMTANSWIVSEIVIVFFMAITIKSLAGG